MRCTTVKWLNNPARPINPLKTGWQWIESDKREHNDEVVPLYPARSRRLNARKRSRKVDVSSRNEV